MEKKLDSNYTRMLRASHGSSNPKSKSWKQQPKKQQLYGHQPPITKTIKVRRTRHVWHCWRSKDELLSDVLLWTPSHGRAKSVRPARTYIQQLCADTRCSPEDLRKQWTIEKGGERGPEISVVIARHDDNEKFDSQFSNTYTCSWINCKNLKIGIYYSMTLYT